MNQLILWVAQGFGIGRIPFAPGTFGSALGLGWFAALVSIGSPWAFLGGCLAGLTASVWFCGKAETILNQTDPGSVVLDEVAAMPVCFIFWVALSLWHQGTWPGFMHFFGHKRWVGTLLVFVGFRLFDVIKPWPVYQSQALPGGWGVTVDDSLAAVYVNIVGFGVGELLRRM